MAFPRVLDTGLHCARCIKCLQETAIFLAGRTGDRIQHNHSCRKEPEGVSLNRVGQREAVPNSTCQLCPNL